MLEREEIRTAIDKAGGNIAAAAAAVGVCRSTLYAWIGKVGLFNELRRRHGRSPNARRGGGRAPNQVGAAPQERAAWYARQTGTSFSVVTAQAEPDEDDLFLSLKNPDGDMVTIRFPGRAEARRMLAMSAHGRDAGEQEQSFVADIQVTSAASRERIARLVGAVRNACDPDTAKKILAAAEIK